MAPTKVLIVPLSAKEEFDPLVQEVCESFLLRLRVPITLFPRLIPHFQFHALYHLTHTRNCLSGDRSQLQSFARLVSSRVWTTQILPSESVMHGMMSWVLLSGLPLISHVSTTNII